MRFSLPPPRSASDGSPPRPPNTRSDAETFNPRCPCPPKQSSPFHLRYPVSVLGYPPAKPVLSSRPRRATSTPPATSPSARKQQHLQIHSRTSPFAKYCPSPRIDTSRKHRLLPSACIHPTLDLCLAPVSTRSSPSALVPTPTQSLSPCPTQSSSCRRLAGPPQHATRQL